MYFPSGDVMNCIRSQRVIGNIKDQSIHEILADNTETKQNMLDHKDGLGCNSCYSLEGDKKGFDIISDRVFYLKELKAVDKSTYDQVDNFDLRTIDIRWMNKYMNLDEQIFKRVDKQILNQPMHENVIPLFIKKNSEAIFLGGLFFC